MSDDEYPDPERPDAIRVARRAMALYAVASRASFEWAAPAESGEEYRASLLEWVAKKRLESDLEPRERDLLLAPIGVPAERDFFAASWRVEGAAVLAWSLGLIELRTPDNGVGLRAVGDCLMGPVQWDDLQLLDPDQITRFEGMYYILNWRVNDYRRRQGPYDLRSKLSYYAAPYAGAAPLLHADDGDLLIGDRSYTLATDKRRSQCAAVIIERRRAATWLCGDDPVYSQVEMDT